MLLKQLGVDAASIELNCIVICLLSQLSKLPNPLEM